MEVALESNGFFIGIEYLATFCCGMVGGLAAVRKGYDIFCDSRHHMAHRIGWWHHS